MTTANSIIVKTLNKETFQRFLSDELTVKEVKELEPQIAKRFEYIVGKIGEETGRIIDWYDYDNQGGEYHPGTFDTNDYNEQVGYTGEFSLVKSNTKVVRYDQYDNIFPTAWFYTNFEVALKKEIEEFLSEQKHLTAIKEKGKMYAKEEMQKMRESIMKKLTTEELSYIAFVKLEDVRKNKANVTKSVFCEVSQFTKEMKRAGIPVSEQYAQYRENNKKAKDFESWVLKNMEKIRKSTLIKLNF